jgi:MoxR-like ATPase
MARLSLGYPAVEDEILILKRRRGEAPFGSVSPVADTADIREMQRQTECVYVDDDLYGYIARIACATREDARLRMGASPRASLALLSMSKSAAWISGRDYVAPKDIDVVLFDVLEHRMTADPYAPGEGGSVREIIADIVRRTPRPQIAPKRRKVPTVRGSGPDV